jgi:hypothetical protein
MSKYRIKKIYKVTPNEGEVIEKMCIQRKFLWWWRTVTIPIIMATYGKDILEISAFGGEKLECSDEWYSDEEWEDLFRLIDRQKYPNIGLAWHGKSIVYYDKVKYVFSYKLNYLIGKQENEIQD